MTETPRSAAWPALWVVLMVMLAIPIPLRGIPMPERGVPILYLVVAGTVLILIHIARTSLPLALLLGYTLFWVLTSGFPVRGVQILVLMVLGALLYIEASRLTASWVRRVAWAFIVGSILQVVLGLINMLHVFPSPTTPALALRWIGVDPMPVFKFFDAGPWLSLMTTEFLGRPMGWLTHPNFWGSYVALAVPVVYVVLGRWWGLGAFSVVSLSMSVGPVSAAAAGLVVIAWRDLPKVLRPTLVTVACLAVFLVTYAHVTPRLEGQKPLTLSTLSSGRTAVWDAAWPTIKEHPIVGNGIGSWRLWANEYNRTTAQPTFATLQAHNELLQFVFEWGLIGLAFVGWWLWQLSRWARAVWAQTAAEGVMWVAVAAVAVVNSFVSPTFHLPAQAAIALFAAGRLEAARRGA